MNARTPRRARYLLALAGLFLTLASSPYPGGCGSPVQQSKPYSDFVNESCDTIVNGKPSCGSQDGACDVIVNGVPMCGQSNSTNPSPSCPNPSYPNDCGNGFCCPTGFAFCCADSSWCGTDQDACNQAVDDPFGGASSGSTDPSSGSGSGPGCDVSGSCSEIGGGYTSYADGCCTPPATGGCALQACADGCANSWYVVNGARYGNCQSADQSCINAAAMQAVAACGD